MQAGKGWMPRAPLGSADVQMRLSLWECHLGAGSTHTARLLWDPGG